MSRRKKAPPLFLLFLISAAAVQGQTSLTVSPFRTDLEITAGKTRKESFTVGNDSARAMKILVQAEDWTLGDDGQIVLSGPAERFSFSCKDWIKADSQEFLLKPGERRRVSWSLSVPLGTPPGHYWTAVSFETVEGTGGGDKNSLMIKGKIMASVFVLVGKAPAQGEIMDVSLVDREKGSMVVIRFKNSGRSYFMTSGRLEIKDARGKKILAADLPEEIVLPGIGKNLDIELEETLPAGALTISCSVRLPSRKRLEFEKTVVFEKKKDILM
jgi:hypothetical protein